MKKTSSGNVTLTSHEFIHLASFVTYVLSLSRKSIEEYESVDNVLLSKEDIAYFKRIERFINHFNE